MKPHGNGNKSKVSFDKDEGGLCESDERRDVAQPGSATVWGTGGRKFKSCHPDKPNNNHLIFQVVILFLLCHLVRVAGELFTIGVFSPVLLLDHLLICFGSA